MKRVFLLLIFCFGAAMLAACSSSPPPAEFTVEMTEFAYSPDTIEVQVGQEVTIHLVNKGALNHEFMVGHDAMMMEGMPSGFEHNMFEGHEPEVMGANGEMMSSDEHDSGMEDMEGMDHGFMVMVNRDDVEKTLKFTVTEDMVGEWQIGCFSDGGSHYEQGMTGTFIVNP